MSTNTYVAAALHGRVRVMLEPLPATGKHRVLREKTAGYKSTRRRRAGKK